MAFELVGECMYFYESLGAETKTLRIYNDSVLVFVDLKFNFMILIDTVNLSFELK